MNDSVAVDYSRVRTSCDQEMVRRVVAQTANRSPDRVIVVDGIADLSSVPKGFRPHIACIIQSRESAPY